MTNFSPFVLREFLYCDYFIEVTSILIEKKEAKM